MKASHEKRSDDASQLAVVAPLLPFLMAPYLSLQLQGPLPSAPARALAVGLIVASLSLVTMGARRLLRVRLARPRKLGPAAMAVVLGAVAATGAVASSFIN